MANNYDYRSGLTEREVITEYFKVIIAGGRDFDDYGTLVEKCDELLKNKNREFCVLCGMADGADALGARYGMRSCVAVYPFPADWEKHGKKAGYLRNREMARNADALIAFWDGKSKGTKMMIEIAKEEGLRVRVVPY